MPDRLVPATLVFREDGTLFSPVYGDIYHSAAGALAQAEHVFLRGNGLPERWRGRPTFTIVETGFGTGCNFLTTWAAWRADPARAARLHFVSVEKHPFSRDDLRRAALHIVAGTSMSPLVDELAAAWPPLVQGLHRIELDDARVTLTLAFGDAETMLPNLALRADAFYLDGFAPAKNADLWSPGVFRALSRFADDAATFATYTSAGAVKRALEAAGFAYRKEEGFAGKRAMLAGEFAPRWRVRRYEPPRALDARERDAIVIGAGLAGCALVERLAARGWHTTLIERRSALASEASGNPAGVFHPMLTPDDNLASRLTRAGFLYAVKRWQALERAGHTLSRSSRGLVQFAASDEEFGKLESIAKMLGIPVEFASVMSRDEARAWLGADVARGGWFFPDGGSIDPAALAGAQCAAAGGRLAIRTGVDVARLERRGDGRWYALAADGTTIASASVAIVANAADAARVAGLHHAPTRIVRGQLTLLPASTAPALRAPAIGDGYVVPLADGTVLAGATFEPDDPDPALRADGHRENLARLAGLLPAFSPASIDAAALAGRVAFRCVTSDRMPLVGALADERSAVRDIASPSGARLADIPRASGLYGAFGYGSRGLVWAALAAELIASSIDGEPCPIERDLADAMDPARFFLRALRRGNLD